MWKPSLSSLRSRAIMLVLLAILPLLALTLYSYFDQRERAICQMQREEIIAVRNLATIQETVVSDVQKLLATLVQIPQVKHCDRDTCNVIFARLLEQSPYIASIVATDTAGQLFASAPAVPVPVNYADRPWFKKSIQTRDFVVSDTVLGRASGKYGNILAYPILDGEGRFLGTLAMQLNLEWLGSMLAKSEFPPNTAIVLTDTSRKVLFRYPEPQQYIGQILPDFLMKAMTRGDEGVSEGIGLPGDTRLFAFARLSPPWQKIWLLIGLPREWALGPVNRALVHNLIFLGLVTIFVLAAAWYGGDLFVVRPVRRLRGVTERLATGDLSMRTGPDYPVGELGLLAHSFDQMADSLQEREAESQRLLTLVQQEKEKLTALINSINDEVWFADTQKKFTLANPSALRLFGLDPTDEIDVAKFAESLEVFRADGSMRPIDETPPLRALQGEPVKLEEMIRIPTTGELRYRQVSAAPVRDVSGHIIGSVSVVRDITALKRAEEALRASEEKYRELVEYAGGIILRVDFQGRITFMNEFGERFFGYAKKEILGRHIVGTLIPPVDTAGQNLVAMARDIIADPERYVDNEHEMIKRSGERVWVRWTNKAVLDEAGRVVEIMSIGIDSTARYRTEEALRESEAWLKMAQKAAHAGIWDYNILTGKLTWDEECYALLGLTPDNFEISVENWMERVHPEDRLAAQEAMDKALQGEEFYLDYRALLPDGGIRWLNSIGQTFFADSDPVRMTGICIDITERKWAEEALHRAHDELEQRVRERTAQLKQQADMIQDLYNNAPCGYHSLDKKGRFVQVNETELTWLGYSQQEMLGGMKFSDLLTADGLKIFQENFPSFLQRGWVRDLEFDVTRKDGTVLPVSLSATTFKDETGKYLMSRSTIFDITERRRAEVALRESEHKLRNLTSQILTAQEEERKRISMGLHEGLGQSLMALKMQLGFIQNHLPPEPVTLKEDFDHARNQLKDMVEEVRRISRDLSPALLENLGLVAALNYLLSEFSKYQGITVTADIDDIHKFFSLQTETHIFRIFQESINNIAKHAQATQVSITIKKQNTNVNFSIKDNGVGFDLEQITSEKPAYIGMGLAAMAERLRMIGSQLNIWTQKGNGTEISFSIPINDT